MTEPVADLSPSSLAALLVYLAPEAHAAAVEYERLRGRLIRFFEWRACAAAEELADRTLDRVAHCLAHGRVRTACQRAFVYGVAHKILLEVCREERRRRLVLASLPSATNDDTEREPRLAALDECLARLEPADRELLLTYHRAGNDGVERQRLADALGVTVNAVRIRVCRMRAALGECMRHRVVLGSHGVGTTDVID